MSEHHNSGFVSGFLLGLIVGAGLVFLFGTSKGKRVLQMLLDQVEENTAISDLLEIPEDEDEEYIGVEADEDVVEPEEVEESREKKEVRHTVEQKPERAVAKVKRFFKGAPKKMVS